MGINGNFTLFRASGQAAGSSGDYVQDAFLDLSVPASDNSGLTSSSLTNPLSSFFGNTDSPQFGTKTLWVKDLVLIEDRGKWINRKPTYKIIFTENFPAVEAYAYGNIRLRDYTFGKSIDVRGMDDGIGIVGNIRRSFFVLNPYISTGTADILVDGVDTGNDVTFSNLSTVGNSRGVNHIASFVHASSNETNNLHDIRLQANEVTSLNLCGFVVYFENTGANIEQRPGSTYVDKDLITTAAGATLSFASPSGSLGGRTVIYKTVSSTYAQSTVTPPAVSTIAVGSSGTTSVAVTTGQGSNFPAGTGFVTTGGAGSSFYVGSVQLVSTDTLTVSPTLSTFGTSGALYKAWFSGATAPIGATLYNLAYSFDPGEAGVDADSSFGFPGGVNSLAAFYYSDPEKRYRAFGGSLQLFSIDGYYGVGAAGAGFVQFDGNFQAAEVEWVAAPNGGVLHGTFGINGVPGWGTNQGLTGPIKYTAFTDAGPAWNSFKFSFGASHSQVVIHKVNFYQMAKGNTVGNLAYYDTIQSQAARTAVNATYMQLGLKYRAYADELFVTGNWERAVTASAAGGVRYFGNTTALTFAYQYYGKDFALVGTAGGSALITFDGATTFGASFGRMISVASVGFHSISYAHLSGTVMIEAIDIGDNTRNEVVNLQNSLSTPEQDDAPGVYAQEDTPRNPKPGTVWFRNRQFNEMFVYGFDRWNQVAMAGYADDPNLTVFLRSHGTSTGDFGGGLQDVEMFNFASWSTGMSSAAGGRSRSGGGRSDFQGFHHQLDGANTSGAVAAIFQRTNKSAWATLSNRSTARTFGAVANFNGYWWGSKGQTDAADVGTGVATADRWNGSAWSAGTAWANAFYYPTQFVVGGVLSNLGGNDAGGGGTTNHETRSLTDTIGSATAGVAATDGVSGTSTGSALAAGIAVSSAAFANTTNSYQWNGSAWSSAITAAYTQFTVAAGGAGYSQQRAVTFTNGGQTATTSGPVASSQQFNGTVFSAQTASTNSRGACQGSFV